MYKKYTVEQMHVGKCLGRIPREKSDLGTVRKFVNMPKKSFNYFLACLLRETQEYYLNVTSNSFIKGISLYE